MLSSLGSLLVTSGIMTASPLRGAFRSVPALGTLILCLKYMVYSAIAEKFLYTTSLSADVAVQLRSNQTKLEETQV